MHTAVCTEQQREKEREAAAANAPVHYTEQEYSCLVYFLQLLLWLVSDPLTPSMATWQPHLGAMEGLEPLGSDQEG